MGTMIAKRLRSSCELGQQGGDTRSQRYLMPFKGAERAILFHVGGEAFFTNWVGEARGHDEHGYDHHAVVFPK